MTSAAALVLTVLLAILAGCSEVSDLPPIAAAERVEIGALKDVRKVGEFRDATEVAIAVRFANDRRSLRWSTLEVKHGCGSVLLEFWRGQASLGYLALKDNSFFTNGVDGQVTRAASDAEVKQFFALLPTGVKLLECKRAA
jgi:hypothetical protein